MPDIATLRERNATFWAQAAPGWIRHADLQDDAGRPLGAAAMEWLRPRQGERILDIGCGCGGTTADLAAAVRPETADASAEPVEPAATMSPAVAVQPAATVRSAVAVQPAATVEPVTAAEPAATVGLDGQAYGVDLAESMVLAARERFPAERHPGLRFIAADIETIGVVPGAPFDAVFSRMTLMLLADPVAGCTTIRRSLRPGGRLAATVFRDGGVNPWLPAAMLGAAPHVGAVAPLPLGDEPGPFAFADPERVKRILTAAGFDAITIQAHDVILRAPDSPDAVAEWLIELGPAGAAYRTASPPQQANARSGAVRLLSRFHTPGTGYHLPAGHWLITATTT
ncbi:methyltransferase domain-containing protein [Sphaerisporangium flaviroseum]|uniref:Methyltransferase domain-containing protein n=1 Tax=Sphaerisporangium flaviroseum TaxID=509199 RepID=A0ABP7JDQ7_9ACTN